MSSSKIIVNTYVELRDSLIKWMIDFLNTINIEEYINFLKDKNIDINYNDIDTLKTTLCNNAWLYFVNTRIFEIGCIQNELNMVLTAEIYDDIILYIREDCSFNDNDDNEFKMSRILYNLIKNEIDDEINFSIHDCVMKKIYGFVKEMQHEMQ